MEVRLDGADDFTKHYPSVSGEQAIAALDEIEELLEATAQLAIVLIQAAVDAFRGARKHAVSVIGVPKTASRTPRVSRPKHGPSSTAGLSLA